MTEKYLDLLNFQLEKNEICQKEKEKQEDEYYENYHQIISNCKRSQEKEKMIYSGYSKSQIENYLFKKYGH